MNKELIILPDAYGRRTAIFVLVVTLIVGALFWFSGVSGSTAVAAFLVISGMCLLGLLSYETHFLPDHRKVIRVWQLGVLLPVWKRTYAFESLRGVTERFFSGVEYNTWQVGLLTASGKFLIVTYFQGVHPGGSCAEAERFRDYLANLTGLPVLDVQNQD